MLYKMMEFVAINQIIDSAFYNVPGIHESAYLILQNGFFLYKGFWKNKSYFEFSMRLIPSLDFPDESDCIRTEITRDGVPYGYSGCYFISEYKEKNPDYWCIPFIEDFLKDFAAATGIEPGTPVEELSARIPKILDQLK